MADEDEKYDIATRDEDGNVEEIWFHDLREENPKQQWFDPKHVLAKSN